MTPSHAPRTNSAGHPCPPWCVTEHDELTPSHFGEQRAIRLGGEHDDRICAAAVARRGPGALARVSVREAEDLAAIIGMLGAATPDQRRELAEAIRAAAAVIAGAGAPAPQAGQR